MRVGQANGTYFRVHKPSWAFQPLSGAGAARQGGRLNRPGTHALYLAADAQTALAEYQQVSSLLPPGTIVSYDVALQPVVDFTGGYVPGQWDPLWEDFFCDWRKLAIADCVEPPSWVLSDLVLDAGAKGVLFPSVAHPGGINLVIYSASVAPSDTLKVNDPGGDLPVDQSSWIA
ncbi:MAG TPA: RES family NAD+ phosphorylase [Variovorax sp.]|jgi:RES domain-containing protein|nr:RES family NAD+ phosphorylase [Variovorax sp.]